jgi:uncharacterized integral membrane protein
MQWQLIFILGMALVLMVFTFQNPSPVQMRFMGWQTGQIPVIIIILVSLLVGVVVSLLLGVKQTKKLKKVIFQLRTELNESKAPPVISEEEEEEE